MLFKRSQIANSTPGHKFETKPDGARTRAHDILCEVDGLFRLGKWEKALEKGEEARSLDPLNAYAPAMIDRARQMIAQIEMEKVRVSAIQTFKEEPCVEALPVKEPTPIVVSRPKGTTVLSPKTSGPSGPATKAEVRPLPSDLPHADAGMSHSALVPSLGRTDGLRPKVLIIDDDNQLRPAIRDIVESGGFEAVALETSDEAMALFQKLTPDLILCDINLETSSFGGFSLFEKTQVIESLKYVPFVFLTGLQDEALIRTGKALGADDYLVKPISAADLLSTLRGKMNRFQRLRRHHEHPNMAGVKTGSGRGLLANTPRKV